MKHFLYGGAIVLGLFCSAACSGSAVQKSGGNTDIATLFARSWNSPSETEKAVLRKKIVDADPNSRFGMFSRAWLLDRDHRSDEATAGYQACVKAAPDFLPCKYNLARSLDARQSVELYQQICEQNASFEDYGCYKWQIPIIARTGDKAGFQALLEGSRKRATPAVISYLSAYWANTAEKDGDGAITLLDKSIANYEYDYDAILLWMNLKAPDGRLNPSGPEDIREIEAPMIAFAKGLIRSRAPSPRIATVFQGLADKMHSAYQDDADAIFLYQQALQYYPSSELLEKLSVAGQDTSSRWHDAVITAHDTLPDNFAVTKAFAQAQAPDDVESADRSYRLAIDQAPTTSDKIDVKLAYADFLTRLRLDHKAAKSIYEAVLPDIADKSDVYDSLYHTLVAAGDFGSASEILVRYQNYLQDKNRANLAVFDNMERQLQELKSFEEQKQVRATAPFVLAWVDTFKSDAVDIKFPTDSDDLTEAAQNELRLVANHLNRMDASGFYVGLAGVTGASEDPQLPTQRSERVASYLTKTLGVDLSKLQVLQPVVSEPALTSHSQLAPAVRISVLGDLRHPKISVTGSVIATQQIALSPDGRFFATGSAPLQIWDAVREIKLRDLGEGQRPEFSWDGKYLAMISDDLTAVRFYEVMTGRPVAQVVERDPIKNVSWNPGSNAVVYAAGRQLTVFSLEAGKRMAVRELPDQIFSNRVVWLRNALIATAQPQAKEVRLWDERNLEFRRSLGQVDWVHALGASHDGRILAAYDDYSRLTLFNTSDWSYRQTTVPVAAHQIIFSPDDSKMILNNWSGKKNNAFVIVDTNDLQQAVHPLAGPVLSPGPGFAFSRDGRTLYMASGRELSKWQFPSIDSIGVIGARLPIGRGSKALPDRRQLLVYDSDGINLWDTTNGSLLRHWAVKATNLLDGGGDGQILALARVSDDDETNVIALSLDSGAAKQVLHLPYVVDRAARSDTLYGFAGTPQYPATTHEPQLFGTVELYDSRSFARVAQITVPLVRQNLYWGYAVSGGFSAFDLADDGKTIALATWWGDGFGHGDSYSKDVQVFDVPGGQLQATKSLSCGIRGVWFEGDNLRANCDNSVWRLASDSNDAVWIGGKNEGDYFTDGASKSDLRFSARYLIAQDAQGQVLRRKDFAANLVSVVVSQQQNLLFALTTDDEIEYLRLSDFRPLIKSFARADGEWVSFAMDGRYSASASAQAVADVQWVVGDKSVALSQLGRNYNDPALIRSVLTASDLSPIIGPDSDSISRITNKFTESDKIIEITNATATTGLPVGAATLNKQKVTILGIANGQIKYRGDAVLQDGLNEISAVGQQILLWKEEAMVSLFTKPYRDSHAIIIAIDDYRRTKRPDLGPTGYPQLSQMVKQAQRLSDTLASLGFARENIHTLYDTAATSSAIQDLLKEFWAGGRYATADRLFIYFGGHGAVIGQAGILVTYDYDPKRPTAFAIPLSTIRADEMSLITAKQVMVALDACASGLAGLPLGDQAPTAVGRKRLALKEIEAEASSSARNLLVATTGVEPALWEREGGIFTVALVNGLSGQADEGYGIIDFEDIAHYVKTHVKWQALDKNQVQEPQSWVLSQDKRGKMLFVRGQ